MYEHIIERLAEEEQLPLEVVRRRFNAMLQFLDVAARSDSPVSPSKAIDTAWHAFLLHTADYADYCNARFGQFIHHQPSRTGENNREKYVIARTRAERLFGALDPTVWTVPSRALVGAGVGTCHDDGHCDAIDRTAVAADCHDDGHCDGS